MKFIESGMTFSFPDEDVFLIEKSPTYKTMNTNMKICECIVKIPNKNTIFFIEAKSSFPNPDKNQGLPFNENINNIIQKFLNSIALYFGILLNRPYKYHSNLPTNLSLDLFKNQQYKITPILIISDFEESWLSPVKDAFNLSIKSYNLKNILIIDDIIVLNKDLAQKFNFIEK